MAWRAGYAIGMALVLVGGGLLLADTVQPPAAPLFFGEMWLPLGVPSRLVLRPVAPSPDGEAESALAPGEVAGRDLLAVFPERPPQLNDLQQLYKAVELPFSVTLAGVDMQKGASTPAKVRVADGTREQHVAFDADERVVLNGETFTMREIRPWGGIIPEPAESGGAPLAVVALRFAGGTWMENIVAQHDDWLRLRDDLVFRFRWLESENAALESLEKGLPGLESAKWGVEDNGAMNWFESFVVGTGLELADGTAVVLSGVAEEPEPALLVKVARGGEVSDLRVRANDVSDDGLVHFFHPTQARFVLLGYAWQPDTMLLQVYADGEPTQRFMLGRGEIRAMDAPGAAFRLDQALGSAVYLRREDSPLQELVLEGRGRLLRLRQGETLILGNDVSEFLPSLTETTPVYTVGIERNGERETFTLDRETVATVGLWTLQQAAGADTPESWATFYLERKPTRTFRRWAFLSLITGAGVFALSVAIHVYARRRRARTA